MQRFDSDKRRSFHACAFQIAELLAEDARPAEGHAERRRGERESSSARSEQCAAVRRFQQPRAQPFGDLLREKQSEKLNSYDIKKYLEMFKAVSEAAPLLDKK